MSYALLALEIAIVLFVFAKYAYLTDTPKIKGLPEVPGLPVFGSLIAIGSCHARKAQEWSRTYGPVFQVRLGNRRIVFANTYDAVRNLWITQQSALISRPRLYTFHDVVSSSAGLTIGTSPWDESCKNRRKAAATALNRPAVQTYMPIIDLESAAAIKDMWTDADHGRREIDPNPYLQRFALSTSLRLTYGSRIEDTAFLNEICAVERLISNFRSTSNQWQDYLPMLRLFSGTNKEALKAKNRRGDYMEKLLGRLQSEMKAGTDKPCIVGNILKDPEAKLNAEEVKSLCLTMVSAGLDTVPGNLVMGLAYLSTPAGQQVQARAYKAITEQYPEGGAWEACLREEKVAYVTALVKEVLRYWSVIPISLPRTSIKDTKWNDVTIPAGTTFYMNAYAADYDPTHFSDPTTFAPERYLKDMEGTPHYGYGAGSRMCAGSHLANRELYTAFLRIILAFRIKEAGREEDRPIMDSLDCSKSYTALTTDPKPFKVKFEKREDADLDAWLRESGKRCGVEF